MTKKLLIATFLPKNKEEWFIKHVKNKFGINESKLFKYENINKDNELVFTFTLTLDLGERVNIKHIYKTSIIVHKKGKCFYTINAMNKLIELENQLEYGNINYKAYKVDWSKYKDKIILIKANKLLFVKLKRFFS